VEPVTLQEIKTHLREEDSNDNDSALLDLIKSARQEIERLIERHFINTTLKLRLNWFPGTILLERVPVSSVTSIEYVDSNGDTQTLAASAYQTDLNKVPPEITETLNQSWPSTSDEINSVIVTFVAGYGSGENDVPQDAKSLIKLWVEREFHGRYGDIRFERAIERKMDALRWRFPL